MPKRRIVYLILGIIMTLFIFGNSLMPSDVSGSQSGFFTNIIKEALLFLKIQINDDFLAFIVRKTAHFTQFFFWGLFWFLFFRTFVRPEFAPYILTLYLGLIVALSDELIQNFIPGRAMQPLDVLIDFAGVMMALVVCYGVEKIFKKRQKKYHNDIF